MHVRTPDGQELTGDVCTLKNRVGDHNPDHIVKVEVPEDIAHLPGMCRHIEVRFGVPDGLWKALETAVRTRLGEGFGVSVVKGTNTPE